MAEILDDDIQALLNFDAEPDDSLVHVTAAALDAAGQQAFSNVTDLDTANVLYVNRIPEVDGEFREALRTAMDEVKAWEAWEVTKVEETLNAKVKEGALPSDNSTEAKAKRIGYRRKVASVLRARSPWFSIVKDDTRSWDSNKPTQQPNLDILHALLGLVDSPEVAMVLKAIGPGFIPENKMIQPFCFTIAEYEVDTVLKMVRPSISTFSFDVKVSKEPPREGKGPRDPKEGNTQININYNDLVLKFDLDQWKNVRPADKSIELGKGLLKQKVINALDS